MHIDRLAAVSQERFECDYMRANRPVVVTDALLDWDLAKVWTPEYFLRNFAEEKVQVYNSYFDLKSVRKLGVFIQERFNRPRSEANVPYVRWYTKLRDVDFFWADAAFGRMKANWTPPSFLPGTDYVFPFSPAPANLDPRIDLFPAKGLFISERGARTGLHVDPWGSDAVLCQLYGRKTWVMYAPEEAAYLESGGSVVDLANPDHETFPAFEKATPACEFVLEPGDAVYVPHGWYHTAHSDSDSISLTWNFVHRTGMHAFQQWLEQPRSKIDDDILRFFFSSAIDGEVTNVAITRLLRNHFGAGKSAASGALV